MNFRLKGDKEITASEDIVFEVSEQTYSLVFKKSKMDDAGLYTARAQNPAGQMACNSRLKVIRKFIRIFYFIFFFLN